jgi:LacI family transcriptional regulator
MVTSRDVARLARVHRATVSRALNSKTRVLVNEQTARRVLEAAAALSYRPNQIARAVSTSRSQSIGVLVPDITNPLFPPIVRGIEDRLEADGYVPLLANTDNDPARERLVFEALHTRHVDGFIVATARADAHLLGDVAPAGPPVVLVNRSLPGRSLSAVVADDEAGLRLAVAHLVRLGHRRIAYVGGGDEWSGDRRAAFLRAARAAAADGDPRLVATSRGSTEEEQGARACRLLLTRDPCWTAVVAATDLLAAGCYAALQERGLSIPGDVSVVGFDDMPFTDRFGPPLTTIRVPRYEIGRAAAALLLEHLRRDHAPRRLVLSPSLVARKSTAPVGPLDSRQRGAIPRVANPPTISTLFDGKGLWGEARRSSALPNPEGGENCPSPRYKR